MENTTQVPVAQPSTFRTRAQLVKFAIVYDKLCIGDSCANLTDITP